MVTIKILLADDHQMFLESMGMLLHTMKDFELVATATNGREVITLAALHHIDVLICDLQMPLMGGIEVILKLRQNHPDIRVLILSMADDAPHIREAVQAGAAGYLLKTANKSELENAIRTIAGGQNYFSSGVIMSLTGPGGIRENQHNSVSLSDRELQVLRLIVSENSSTQIAEKLFISFNTVETHRKNLYKKLGVNTSLGLLKYALKYGLVD